MMSNDPARQAALEQKVNELMQQSRVYEAYLNDIVSRQLTVGRLIEEARLASTTIQNTSAASEIESLMPVGIGVHIKARVPPVTTLLVSLGAGVTIEKTRDDALNYVEARIKEFEIAARQLETQKNELAARLDQIQSQVNQMLRSAQ
jgi:prefoldin alpha subunit